MRRLLRKKALAQVAVIVSAMAASLFAGSTPAQAYSPNPTAYYVSQDSLTCQETGPGRVQNLTEFWVYHNPDYCIFLINDSLGGHFPFDSGGQNLAVDLVSSSGTEIGAVMFKAAGEHLYIDDLADDSDTFYVWLAGQGPFCACGGTTGIDSADINMDLPENDTFDITITDDKLGTDVIASTEKGTLPAVHP